jgi:hypothetical protein
MMIQILQLHHFVKKLEEMAKEQQQIFLKSVMMEIHLTMTVVHMIEN